MTNTVITVPANGELAHNDSNGKELKFEQVGNDTLRAEGSDGLIYTVQKHPQQATMTTTKVERDSKLGQINDPYYQRLAANRPKPEGDSKAGETTEAREKQEFGKTARRTDIPNK